MAVLSTTGRRHDIAGFCQSGDPAASAVAVFHFFSHGVADG